MIVASALAQHVSSLRREEWTAQLERFGSWTLHNDADVADALARSYGCGAIFLQLRCGARVVGLVNVVLVREFATVAYAPLDRLWARPSILLEPGQRLSEWVPAIGGYLRSAGVDVFAFAAAEDPQRIALKRLQTQVVALPANEGDVLRSLTKRNRRAVRLATEGGVTVRLGRPDDLPIFVAMYREVLTRMGPQRWIRRSHTVEYFERLLATGRALLLIAEKGDRVAAGTIVTRDRETAYYQHNASFGWARDSYANHLLLFTAICHAIRMGLTSFDLGGVSADPAQNYFKRGWGRGVTHTFNLYRVPLTLRGRAHERAVALAFSAMRVLGRAAA